MMKKRLMLFGAFITVFATIMQVWFCVNVMINNYHCASKFCNGDTSDINKMNCMDSINNTIKWHCVCQYYETNGNVDCWRKTLKPHILFLTCILMFIPLMPIAVLRETMQIAMILGYRGHGYTTSEYFSILGIITMIFKPTVFEKKIHNEPIEVAVIIIDILAIYLVFQYSSFINASAMDPFFLITLIASFCDVLKCIYILHRIVRKRRKKIQDNLLVQPEHIQKFI
jgi:hypothetical protein